jgi:hypothetical protein
VAYPQAYPIAVYDPGCGAHWVWDDDLGGYVSRPYAALYC